MVRQSKPRLYGRTPSKLRNIRVLGPDPKGGERWYDSKQEAAYAISLANRYAAGDLTKWEAQVTLRCEVNGVHLCSRRVDFRLTHLDGSIELIEIKGFETECFKVRQKCFQATWLHDHPEVRYRQIQV